ncbi:CBS domain-containing protein [Vampirovibrio sp.]|uniref:CBS domain-containing protein n=1 Tax=Vampirovibrio sp. TaxID=2717857 RepID=UPI003593EE0C
MRLLELTEPVMLTISVNDYAMEAQRLMAQQQSGWIVVLEGLQMIGVVFAQELGALPPATLNDLDVREYLRPFPLTVSSDVSIEEAKRQLIRSGLDFMAVMENNQPIGILTLASLEQKRLQQRQAG